MGFLLVDGGYLEGEREGDGEREEVVLVKQGEIIVVPKGMRHRPDSKLGCEVMLFEKRGTVNTGDVEGSERTREVVDVDG